MRFHPEFQNGDRVIKMDNSIEIENLTKIYGGNIKAVDNVTLK